MRFFDWVRSAAFLVMLLVASALAAGEYPNKPIRIVVPYTPGGNTDVLARLIGEGWTQRWHEQIVVDNRPGGNTVIGTGIVARAPADGYTLLFTTLTLSVLPSIEAKLPFDVSRDFSPVSLSVTLPNVLVINPTLRVKTLEQFIQYARANGGKLSYASTGTGTSPHLSMELLKRMAHFEMTHVPYKGGAPAMTDVMNGEVSALFTGLPIALPHLKTGRLRALAVTTASRSKVAPDIPTIAETLPGYEVTPWFGLLAPARTPAAIISALQRETALVLDSPKAQSFLEANGAEAVASTPEKFATHIAAEMKKWKDLLVSLGIHPQ